MGHLTKCEWGSVPGCLSDSKGCLAVDVQEYATAQDMMQSTCIKAGYAHTLGFYEVGDGGAAYYTVVASPSGDEPNGMDVLQCRKNIAKIKDYPSHPEQLGARRYDSYEEASGAIETTNNAKIIQRAIDTYGKVFLKRGYYPLDNQIILKSGVTIEGLHNETTIVSNGPIFAFENAAYCAQISIIDVNIINNGTGPCVAFKTEQNIPINVFQCRFTGIKATASNGNAFDGGDNKGSTGDVLVFQCAFNDIGVSAPGHAGFYNLNGIELAFNNIYDFNSIRYIFHNSCGYITNFNGTFAGANWMMYYDANASNSYIPVIIINSNIESFIDGAINITTPNALTPAVILNNVTFFHTQQAQLKSVHPFTFQAINGGNIFNFREYNANIWNSIYSFNRSTFKAAAFNQNALYNFYSDGQISLAFNTGYIYDINPHGTTTRITGNNQGEILPTYNRLISNQFIGSNSQVFQTVSEIQNSVYTITGDIVYDGIIYTGGDVNLMQLNTNESNACKLFAFINNGTGTFNLVHGTRISNINAQNVSLSNGEWAVYVLTKRNNVSYLNQLF